MQVNGGRSLFLSLSLSPFPYLLLLLLFISVLFLFFLYLSCICVFSHLLPSSSSLQYFNYNYVSLFLSLAYKSLLSILSISFLLYPSLFPPSILLYFIFPFLTMTFKRTKTKFLLTPPQKLKEFLLLSKVQVILASSCLHLFLSYSLSEHFSLSLHSLHLLTLFVSSSHTSSHHVVIHQCSRAR